MGNSRSILTKPVKKFNVEKRVERVLNLEKPVPAPTHRAALKQLEIARSVAPNFIEDHYKKDAQLDGRLKNVYIESHDPPAVTKEEPNPSKPLPKLVRRQEDFEFGFWEPERIPEGRCTLRTIFTFISEYSQDPVKNSVENIATKYKLNCKDVSNILEYFRVYKVTVSDNSQVDMLRVNRTILPLAQKKEE